MEAIAEAERYRRLNHYHDKEVKEDEVDVRKLNAIYQFAKAVPLLVVPAAHSSDKGNGKKRKRGQER